MTSMDNPFALVSKTHIIEFVTSLLSSGAQAKDAFHRAAEKFNMTKAKVQSVFYRAGGSDLKRHGNCALT